MAFEGMATGVSSGKVSGADCGIEVEVGMCVFVGIGAAGVIVAGNAVEVGSPAGVGVDNFTDEVADGFMSSLGRGVKVGDVAEMFGMVVGASIGRGVSVVTGEWRVPCLQDLGYRQVILCKVLECRIARCCRRPR